MNARGFSIPLLSEWHKVFVASIKKLILLRLLSCGDCSGDLDKLCSWLGPFNSLLIVEGVLGNI